MTHAAHAAHARTDIGEGPSGLHMDLVVRAARGLHARPAGRIVQAVQALEATVRIYCDGQHADARSVIELMTLAAAKGSLLHLTAQGPDAREALIRIAEQCAPHSEEATWPGP